MNMAVDALPVMTAPQRKLISKIKSSPELAKMMLIKLKKLQIVYLNSLRHITSKIKHK